MLQTKQQRQEFTPLAPDSLERLWNEAAQLGRIKVDQGWGSDTSFEVSITFWRKSGTRVCAVGRNTTFAFALADAINEAREMGAGSQP